MAAPQVRQGFGAPPALQPDLSPGLPGFPCAGAAMLCALPCPAGCTSTCETHRWAARRLHAVNKVVEVPLHRPAVLRARRRFLRLNNVFELKDFLEGWFCGTPFDQLRRGNVRELIAYGFYTRRWDQLSLEVRSRRLQPSRLWLLPSK